jgi:hypothetical protein
MVDPVTTGALAVGAKALEKPLSGLLSAAWEPVRILARQWAVAGKRDAIVQSMAEVELVRTVSGPDRVPLSSFYYPAKIHDIRSQKAVRQVRLASEIAVDKNILLYGTVGQGKSIFMRYLCLQELQAGRKIPIFIELRTIELDGTLKKSILQSMAEIGFEGLREVDLPFLLGTGSLIFFLDGFDEIKKELAFSLQSELITLMKTHPTTRWVISTRPGSLAYHIANLPFLQVVRIAPLTDDDFEPFLTALCVPDKSRRALLEAIGKSPTEIKGVLRTPLMLTLLNMTFGTSTQVPSTLHEFYESMFLFLVYRHDETKPGFVRPKATNLTNAELQNAFEHFAFLSKEHGVSLSDEEFSLCTKRTATLSGLQFTSEGLRTDLTETVCLMMRDGLRTAYIHRSIQEFFAAFFVKHLGEEQHVKLIYERLSGNDVMAWQQELRFLEQIDRFRYMEYFRLPAIRKFLAACSYTASKQVGVTKVNFLSYLRTQPIIAAPNPDGKNFWIIGLKADRSFDVFTLEVSKLLACDGYIDDAELLPKAVGSKSGIQKMDRYFLKNDADCVSALTKFRDFVRRIYKEQLRIEKSLHERKGNLCDLLLPKAAG